MVVRNDILPTELTDEQRIVVDRILHNFTDSLNTTETFVPRGERSRQPKPAQDIDGFTDLVMEVINEQQISEEVPENLRVKFLQDFQPEDIQTEVITFGLLNRMPASFSRGQHENQRVREVKPHIRGIEDDAEIPGFKRIIHGQRFENEMVFTCWAKTNKAADKRARWLEDTLRDWTWYIRYKGVTNFYFKGQDADITLDLDGTRNVLVGRPMRYWVMTERLSTVLERTIWRIVVKYGLGQS